MNLAPIQLFLESPILKTEAVTLQPTRIHLPENPQRLLEGGVQPTPIQTRLLRVHDGHSEHGEHKEQE